MGIFGEDFRADYCDSIKLFERIIMKRKDIVKWVAERYCKTDQAYYWEIWGKSN